MRTHLEDVLADHPELANAQSRDEAEERLRELFLTAQQKANSYASERLDEIYEVAERALALGAAFPPEKRTLDLPKASGWTQTALDIVTRYGGGLLLAACAPIVAEASLILAGACGVAAVLMLSLSRRKQGDGYPALPPPNAPREKFEGLVSAADRSLGAMTAPRALAPPSVERSALADEDVLTFLQEAIMLKGSDDPSKSDLAENAERLAVRAGYEVVWEEDDVHFEIMIDPGASGDFLLKPALKPRKSSRPALFGVIVKGKGAA